MKTLKDFLIPMADAVRIIQDRPEYHDLILHDVFTAAACKRISWAEWALHSHNQECQYLAQQYAGKLSREFHSEDIREAKNIYSPLTGKGTLHEEQTQLLNLELRQTRWLNAICAADPLFRHLIPTTPPPPSKALVRKYTHPAPCTQTTPLTHT